MKKFIVLLSAFLLCTVLLNGCKIAHHPDTGIDIQVPNGGALSKAQQIVISDAATEEVLAVFNGKEEIKGFLEKLDEDRWSIKDFEDLPENTERECVIAMLQTETLKAGMEPEDRKTVQLCTLYTYRGNNCLTMAFPFASFTFTLSDDTAAYLHSFAQ